MAKKKRRILVQWIGNRDLSDFANDDASVKDQIEEALASHGSQLSEDERTHRMRTLFETESFDEIYLLTDYPEDIADIYGDYLRSLCKADVAVDPAAIKSAVDYESIYSVCEEALNRIYDSKDERDEVCIHLTPGTDAMHAVWVLLSKTRFPATFYETLHGDLVRTEIPFDVVSFITEVNQGTDNILGHLQSHAPGEVAGFERITGDSPAIREAVGRAQRVAISSVNVLILGESGSGKELFARAIHNASERRNEPFIAINCAALPRELAEAELFGSVAGAGTQTAARDGAFVRADKGTLFLDEVGECDLDIQAKLLRALDSGRGKKRTTRTFTPVGSNSDKTVDVRIIAATNRDPFTAIKEKRFRSDLYWRLNTFQICLPRLIDRREDIPALVDDILNDINEQFRADKADHQDKTLTPEAMSVINSHHWPGNVRELRSVLTQCAILSDTEEISAELLRTTLVTGPQAAADDFSWLPTPKPGFDIDDYIGRIQSELAKAAVNIAGTKTAAGELLGKTGTTVSTYLKQIEDEE